MLIKPINWRGTSFRDIRNEAVFSSDARRIAGYQLFRVQAGLEPEDWKPFDVVGSGVKEIRINLKDGCFRILYLAKFPESVFVLHCFKKKSASTSKFDKEIAEARYRAVIRERNARET